MKTYNPGIKNERRKIFMFLNIALLVIIAFFIVLFVLWVIKGNNTLTVSNYNFNCSKISSPIRIVQISDLHNKQFGENNSLLYDTIEKQKPDLIAVTGDLIDRRQPYNEKSAQLLIELAKKYPVYFIYGNQEMSVDYKDTLASDLSGGGVKILDGRNADVIIHGQVLSILGLNDFDIESNKSIYANNKNLLNKFQSKQSFKLLLTHYPNFFYYYNKLYRYSDYKIDLVLAGHAHGGLIRLSFININGLYAPGQGLFPKYTSGLYEQSGVSMIVSRGLGNSGIPFRINNPPDLVVVNLLPKK